MIQLLNQKGGSKETRKLDLFWKSQRAFSTSNSESKFEFNLWKKTILTLGLGFSYGTIRYVNNYIKYNTQSLADTQEEEYVPTSLEVVAARSKAKAKTSIKGVYWHNNHPIKWKSVDWYWTIKARSRVAQVVKESHQSSSTQPEITSRARWSSSILQN